MRKETLLAPVSGLVVFNDYCHTTGTVQANELILQIESMKMYIDVTCAISGKIKLIIKEGEFVQEGQVLGEINE